MWLVRFTFRSAKSECYKPFKHKSFNLFWVKKPAFFKQDFKPYLHALLKKSIKKNKQNKKVTDTLFTQFY